MDPQLGMEMALQDGIDLRTVATTGSTFSVEMIDDDEAVDASHQPLTHVNVSSLTDFEHLFSTDNFEKLAADMVDIGNDGYIKKKILSIGGGHPVPPNESVRVRYAGFWEREKYPFDWKLTGAPKILNLGLNEILPGMENAIMSMEIGEKSIFLLSYQVMYGIQGCPPRVRAKESCLFYIHVIGLADAKINHQPKEFDMASKYYAEGKALFAKKSYKFAAHSFSKAADILQKSHLVGANEEEKQNTFLIKIYLYMAVCYNKLNLPKKVCMVCNNLHRINSLWDNPKALFQNARALMMLEDYLGAERCLQTANELRPNNDEILQEMSILKKKMDKQQRRNDCIKITNLECRVTETVSKEFEDVVTQLFEDFYSNSEDSRLLLPSGLSKEELNVVSEVAKKYGLLFGQVDQDELHVDKYNKDDGL